MTDTLCPYCGAYSTRACEWDPDQPDACPWFEIGDEDDEPDPDILREDRDERRRIEREHPDHE